MKDRDNVTEIRPGNTRRGQTQPARISPDDPVRDVLAAAYDEILTANDLVTVVERVLWDNVMDNPEFSALSRTLDVAKDYLKKAYEAIEQVGASIPRERPASQS